MIQRIQTLYLLIADLLIAILFFVPFAELYGNGGKIFIFYLTGIISEGADKAEVIQRSWPLFLLTCMVLGFLNLVIFQYKKRERQIKLAWVTVILLLGLMTSVYFSVWKCQNLFGGNYSMKIFFTFPLIAAIFVYLAIRSIAKDERLVKSINRIRR
jgi:CDP-diglyceride synthetase